MISDEYSYPIDSRQHALAEKKAFLIKESLELR